MPKGLIADPRRSVLCIDTMEWLCMHVGGRDAVKQATTVMNNVKQDCMSI